MTAQGRTVRPVDYDRSAIKVGIMHFGVGNFHRSHQAMYLDRLLRNGEAFEWGICGVGVLPGDVRMRDALRRQDFEYTLVERASDGTTTATRIGSILDVLHAPDQLDEVVERLADPATRIVSLTITEGGYNISAVTGRFDVTDPAVLEDVASPTRPSTVFGIIVAGLRLRRERGVAPFTVMSCDNIEENGEVARESLTAFAALLDEDLADWIGTDVAFPNSMVDRITPVTTDDDRRWVEERFGVEDSWPVVSEDFVQWVLEDDFPLGRPPWEQVAVQLVQDVRPYELMKLRLLNAGHQALAYPGLLAGYEYVHDAAADPAIAAYLRAYMDAEATPTLDPVPGVDLDAYKDRLIQRFTNPHVRDTLGRLATDAADRIPKFLVPVIRELRARGVAAPLSTAVIAGWAHYAELSLAGRSMTFRDRQEFAVEEAVELMKRTPDGFLQNPDWFGDLSHDAMFVEAFVAILADLRETVDPRTVLARLAR